MNLHKYDPLQVSFERTFGALLKLWSQRKAPPHNGRANLLAAAKQIQQKRVRGLQISLLHREYINGQPRNLTTLFYAPQMSYMTALINF